MENYQDFFSHAKLYTGVHAKPTVAQMKAIEQSKAAHGNGCNDKNNKEEQKSESDQPSGSFGLVFSSESNIHPNSFG